MKPSYLDLKINNIVYNLASGSKEICKVEAISKIGVKYNSESRDGNCGWDNLELIKLTEKWLEDFGANIYFTSDPQERQASKAFEFDNLKIHMCNEDVEEFIFEASEFIKIEYVSQLQNLYYSINNKPLIVK